MLNESQPLPESVDGILIGGGHNSLVAAAYLGKAGVRTLVLESSDKIGGGVTTDEVTLPLFLHNLHAFFVRWTPDYRIWKDLDLDRYGLRSVHPEVQNGVPFGDDALVTYRELGPSLEAIRRLSPSDAENYARLHAEFSEIVDRLEGPLRFGNPLPPDELEDRLSRSEIGRRYLSLKSQSALDVVREAFESEPLRALIAFNVSVRGYLPNIDVPGTGYIVTLALPNSHDGRIIAGGSYQAARTLAAVVYENGGRVVTGAEVASIEVHNGRATGVTLADGRAVKASRFVASSVPAPMTMLEMVGRSHLDSSLADDLAGYAWNPEALFGVHYALSRRPRFTAEATVPDLPRALNLAVGYESSDDIVRDMEAIRAKRLSPIGALHGSFPTVNDPSQAPPGFHTSFGWHFVPSSPDTDFAGWGPAATEERVRAITGAYSRYAPDFEDCLVAVRAHTPVDTVAQVPSMRYGDRHHGSYHPKNWETFRPHPDLAGYRTPIEGLYLCGASQHPGGSFTGGPGYNAAGDILSDLGEPPWWSPPDPRRVLEDLQ